MKNKRRVGLAGVLMLATLAFSGTTFASTPLPKVTSKDQCMNNGWKAVGRADHTAFKNQGDCIQYVNTGK